MDDINTMWVWIPRYEYNYVSIQTAGGQRETCTYGQTVWECYKNPGEIDIQFISINETEDQGDYKIHPAFTFGDDELTGFWYGKFETSNKEQTCTAAWYSVDTACDKDTFTPQIKPGVTSWRGIRVSTAFTVSQKMAKNTTEYGFGESTDTHMSKNSEWGAVAYLSQSKYGKYGKDKTEVAINSCNTYTTGVAGCSENYISTNGLKTSTTGNITGVYDMSGVAWEYVMGALTDGQNKPRSGQDASYNSGFNGVLDSGGSVTGQRDLPEAKYYDLYTSTTSASACRDGQVCYGHALSETGGWYGDYSTFVSSTYPWFERGGHYNNIPDAGVFASATDGGYARVSNSFRLVLVSTGA